MARGKKSVEHTLRVYLWLIGTLYGSQEGLTLKELNELWLRNAELSDGVPLSRQAIYKYMRSIKAVFKSNVVIECNRHNNKYTMDTDTKDKKATRLFYYIAELYSSKQQDDEYED